MHRYLWGGVAALTAAASLTFIGEAHGVVGEVYTAVINAPLVIPQDGVLAVASRGSGNWGTSGTLRGQITHEVNGAVPGSQSDFTVALDDAGTTQLVSLWIPDEPFSLGKHSTSGDVSTQFEVVAAPVSTEPPTLEFVAISLGSREVAKTQIPCGETIDAVSFEPRPSFLTTQYGVVPQVTLQLGTTGASEVLSQLFLRDRSPDAFLPANFEGAVRTTTLTFAGPQASYCLTPEWLSLRDQSTSVAMSEVCIDDDGTDWARTIDATSDQIEMGLRRCPEPPAGYEEQFCAGRAALGLTAPACDSANPQPGAGGASPQGPEMAPVDTEPSMEPDPAPGSVPEQPQAPGPDEEPSAGPGAVPLAPVDAAVDEEPSPGTDIDPVDEGDHNDGVTGSDALEPNLNSDAGTTSRDSTALEANAGDSGGGCSVSPNGDSTVSLSWLSFALVLASAALRRGCSV